MTVIGICGSSGSGKGYVCKLLENYGIKWIDTDLVYRGLTGNDTACLRELEQAFGGAIISESGALNRVELAKIVFEGENADENRAELNRISHKHIRKETERLIEIYKNEGAIGVSVDAPVLFESGFDKMCDTTICVTATLENRIERIIKRDNVTREKALYRLNCQKTDEELRALCKYEIDNSNGSDLEKQIEAILTDLCIIN